MPYGTVNADVVQSSVSGVSLGAGNASAMKNRIINGAMVIDQRNAGASVTPASGQYTLDRWTFSLSQASKISTQQSSTAPAGFVNSSLITSLSSYSVSAGDLFLFEQHIEGYNIADLGWGTADAKPVTLSFWVRSSLTGTFGGGIQNSAQTRSYPFSYTISSANTWTQISITIAGETSGTWLKTNGIGMYVFFGLGVGSTYSGTAGSWSTNNYLSATGATSVVGTSGATFYITGVQLEVGSSATGFEYRQYGTEMSLCQRYYYKIYGGNNYSKFGTGPAGSTTSVYVMCQLQTLMRDKPSSITTTGSFGIWSGATVFIVSSLVLETNTGQNIGTVTATTSGITAEKTYQLLANVDSTATLAFSAEL
jgi:hypothetical protein